MLNFQLEMNMRRDNVSVQVTPPESARFKPMKITKRFVLALAALLIFASPPASAQLGTATISGVVTDNTGAVMVRAAVITVNLANGFRRETVTNQLGQYALPGLTPGIYEISIEMPGFKKYDRKQLHLEVDQNARIDATLEVGQVTESIEVIGQAPLIESENASLGAVVDTRTILGLPLNGRNFVQLALLVPGANSGALGTTSGGGFSVSGTRSEENAFQIDGTSNTDSYQNRITVTPSIDSLQEFKIQTNNYSAEFGKGAGAQINVITKSGTLQFHGTMWEFVRNNHFQARRFFDTNRISFPCDRANPNVQTRAACAPAFNQNQFGFVLGGPMFVVPKVKGERKTFFFVNYEGFRQRRGAAIRTAVPSLAQRNGDFSQNLLNATAGADALGRSWRRGQLFDPASSRQVTVGGRARYVRDPFPGNVIPASRFDPVAARMLANKDFIPLPNAPGTLAGDGSPLENFLDGRSNRSDFDQFGTRIDHQFTANDTVYGRFLFNDANSFDPRTFPGFGTLNNQRTLNGTFSYTKVLRPTVLNEFRFGYQGWFQLNAPESNIHGVDWVKKFSVPGLAYTADPAILGAPSVGVSGFASWGDTNDVPVRPRNNTFQFLDSVSFNKGRHFMKVGFEARRVRDNIVRAQFARGDFSFTNPQWTGIDGVGNTGNSLANFILGLSRQKSRRIGDPSTRLRATEYGAYFQDDFKVLPNLTLNLGFRYSLYLPPKDTRNAISTLVSTQRCPSYSVCGPYLTVNSPYVPHFAIAGKDVPESLSPVDKKNFGPRIGFAWRPFGGTKTVLRGGYGIFYDTVPVLLTEDSIQNYPFVTIDQQDLSLVQNGPPPPEGLIGFLVEKPSLTGPVAPFVPSPKPYSPDFHNAYIQMWNFGIQRELPGNMMFEVAYVGSKGTRLNERVGTNYAEPLGPRATIGDLTNDPTVPNNVGAGRNQFRRLIPFVLQDGVIVPVSNIAETMSTAFSNYHGLQTRLERRFSQGLSILTTYTFSKAISNASSFNDPGGNGAGGRIQNLFNKSAEKGLAEVDHRHRFTTAFGYELPVGRGKRFGSVGPAALDKIIGGWGVDGIVTLQSGYPITVRRSGDPGGRGIDGTLRPDLVCAPNLGRGQQTVEKFFRTECFVEPETLVPGDVRFGTAGISTVEGPGLLGIDLAARKFTNAGERVKTEFRAEFFNALNHANWGLPGRDLGASGFGRITSTLDPRIIQFGLKLQF